MFPRLRQGQASRGDDERGERHSLKREKGAPVRWGALVVLALAGLEQELQSKLDLTRIVEWEARGPNLAEVRGGEVE